MQALIRKLVTPALIAVLATVTACGDNSPQAAVDPAPTGPAGAGCTEQLTGTRQVSFGPHGADLVGVVRGTGTTGIVLAHQSGGSLCQWIDSVPGLADQGYRVLAFDFGGFGGSAAKTDGLAADVVAAAAFLRQDGATRIVLMGGSMGGTAALVAASTITPPVAAVISLSAPTDFSGVDALGAVPAVTVPILYAAGENDSSYATAAQELYAASKASTGRRLFVAPAATGHGVSLTSPLIGDSAARDAVAAFLKEHAPA